MLNKWSIESFCSLFHLASDSTVCMWRVMRWLQLHMHFRVHSSFFRNASALYVFNSLKSNQKRAEVSQISILQKCVSRISLTRQLMTFAIFYVLRFACKKKSHKCCTKMIVFVLAIALSKKNDETSFVLNQPPSWFFLFACLAIHEYLFYLIKKLEEQPHV